MKQAHAPPDAGNPAGLPATRPRRRVLLVGATQGLHARLAVQLREAGHVVEHAATGQAVLARDPARLPALVLCEHLLPDMFGVLLCNALRRSQPDRHFHFILMGDDGADAALIVQSGGVDDVLPLPVHDGLLRLRIAVAERMLDMANALTRMNRGLASTLDNLRAAQAALDRDLAEARRLQQGLVPDRFQQFGPTRLSLLLRPSGQVGGDLIGSFPICRCRLGIYAIDVAGHGVTAALVAARLSAWLSRGMGQWLGPDGPDPPPPATPEPTASPIPPPTPPDAAARAAAGRPSSTALTAETCNRACTGATAPADLVGQLNRMMLADAAAGTYFTMVYAELNTRTGDGLLVQAGHPSPILQAADGAMRLLGQGGLPVGLFADASYATIPFRLRVGERLFIASDGLIEAENPQGALLGEAGLMAAMRVNARLAGPDFIESICGSVGRFTEGKQDDDISAVLIEFGRDPRRPPD